MGTGKEADSASGIAFTGTPRSRVLQECRLHLYRLHLLQAKLSRTGGGMEGGMLSPPRGAQSASLALTTSSHTTAVTGEVAGDDLKLGLLQVIALCQLDT